MLLDDRASSVLRALQQANEIRSARAQLKRDLASGRIELARILARPPEFAKTAKVLDLLLFLPKVGPVKAGRMLAQCRIAHSRKAGHPILSTSVGLGWLPLGEVPTPTPQVLSVTQECGPARELLSL